MAEAKTKPTRQSVAAFIETQPDAETRADCRALVELMEKITKEKATMWGPGIVGFGTYTYTYASGRTGDWPLAAFAPRKRDLTIYLMAGYAEDAEHAELLPRLGKHSTSKACLYVKRLADLHLPTLRKLVTASVVRTRKTHGRRG